MKTEPVFPPVGGSYALFLFLEKSLILTVGRLGSFEFPAGRYVYLGSAFGTGGLRARLGHHLRIASNPRWHIDYLRAHAEVDGIWYVVGGKPLECVWSHKIGQVEQARLVASGFGASDCRNGCASHLWWVGTGKGILGEMVNFE